MAKFASIVFTALLIHFLFLSGVDLCSRKDKGSPCGYKLYRTSHFWIKKKQIKKTNKNKTETFDFESRQVFLLSLMEIYNIELGCCDCGFFIFLKLLEMLYRRYLCTSSALLKVICAEKFGSCPTSAFVFSLTRLTSTMVQTLPSCMRPTLNRLTFRCSIQRDSH